MVYETAPPSWSGVVKTITQLIKYLPEFVNCKIRYIHTNYRLGAKKDSNRQNHFKPLIIVNDFPIVTTGFLKIRWYVDWADIVILHETASMSLYALFWSIVKRKKTILWEHINTYELTVASIKKKYLAIVAGLITWFENYIVSKLAKIRIHWDLGLNTKDTSTDYSIPFCIDYEKFNRHSNRFLIRKKYNINKNYFCFGYVGRLSKDKNVELIYEIGLNYLSTHEDTFMICIGRGSFTPPRFLIEHKRFLWIKETNKVEIFMNCLDAILLMSETEVGPFVIPEAMACGAVPISRKVGICTSLIQHGQSGYLLSSAEPTGMQKETLKYLAKLRNNPDLLKTLSKNAHKRVRQYCPNWKRLVKDFSEKLLQNI